MLAVHSGLEPSEKCADRFENPSGTHKCFHDFCELRMQAKVLVHREKLKRSLFYSSTEKIFFNFTLIIDLQNAKNNVLV